METTSLFSELIKTDNIHFRNVKIGDPIELIEQIEGIPTEIKEYSNPFYRYSFEIGEMEEISLYYNYDKEERLVNQITLHFIHYPDHYWKKAGHNDPMEFWNLLNNSQLQPYSTIFTNTVNDLVAFFTRTLNQEPVISSKIDGAFDSPHQNYKALYWNVQEQYILSIQTYVDDSIDDNVKNTLILRMIGS
jgi:hypothetical protein